MELILATLLSCSEVQRMIQKIYTNEHFTTEDRMGLYDSFREVAPDGCLADTAPRTLP